MFSAALLTAAKDQAHPTAPSRRKGRQSAAHRAVFRHEKEGNSNARTTGAERGSLEMPHGWQEQPETSERSQTVGVPLTERPEMETRGDRVRGVMAGGRRGWGGNGDTGSGCGFGG